MFKSITLVITVLFTIFYSSETHAAFAKVLKVKGKVSYLGPGMTHPKWVKKGMTFKEDTSLVTRGRSFIKVRILDDGSNVTLGAGSKLVLTKIKKKKGSIISLLNGQMRAKVEKRKDAKKHETKVYIKTRTAALGVRGTEFITVVNQDNQVTSLVTLEGEVAINKIDSTAPDIDVEKTVKEAVDSTEQVTLVKKGNASTSYLHKQEVTAPTKVNPTQLVALKKNADVVVAKKEDVKEAQKVELTEDLKKELYAADDATGKVTDVPKNGAIVDLKSAIFIPEVKDEKLKLGKIDKNTGTYVPLDGVKLDVNKGFLVADAGNKAAVKLVKKLKKHVEYKPLPKNYAPGHHARGSGPWFAMEDNKWSIHLHAGPVGFEFDDNNSEESTVGAMMFGLDLNYERFRSPRLSWLTTLGIRAFGIDKKEWEAQQDPDEGEDNLGGFLAFGMKYKVSNDFSFITRVIGEDEFFPIFAMSNNSLSSLGLKSKTAMLTKLELATQVALSNSWTLKAYYHDIFSANKRDIVVEFGKSMGLDFTYQYKNLKKHQATLQLKKTDLYYNDTFVDVSSVKIGHIYNF